MKTAGLLAILGAFVSANAAPLPFSETFDALNSGPLAGQNEWAVQTGTATVQTNVVQSGTALELVGGSASHALSTTNSIVWVTCWAKYTGLATQNPVVTNANTSVAFYINTTGNLVVCSNTTPVELSVQLETNVWVRFDVYCDYDNLTWNLSVNQTNVAAGLPLYCSTTQIDSLQVQNGHGTPIYIDEIAVTDIEPTADMIDKDGDSIPDWWEQKYFGSIIGADPSGVGSNGINNHLEAYIAGLDPTLFERFEMFGTFGAGSTIEWVGRPGRRYSVFSTTNLHSAFIPLQTNILWSQSGYTDLVNTNEQSVFYKIQVELDQSGN
jgi:hypothetical protein